MGFHGIVIINSDIIHYPNPQSTMNDIINNAIDFYVSKGRKIEVIRRYIRMKYRINIEKNAFRQRVKNMRLEYES